MTREIKFRAWDKITKRFYDKIIIDAINERVYLDAPAKIWKFEIEASLDRTIYEVELMQYTGLKDKNGKEIYEGDIIKVRYNRRGRPGTEPCDKDGYSKVVVEADEEDTGFKPFSEHFDNSPTYLFDRPFNKHPEDYEVIGNIYENPELLETKE